MRIHPAFALVIALVAGCAAGPTPYQAADRGLGYSQQRLETNRYRITFAGNSLTPRQTVENYLLYRAAELTLENGFDYFVMTGESTLAETTYEHTLHGYGGWGPYYWYPYGMRGSTTTRAETEFEAEATVLLYKGPKPDNERRAFDAREVKANLEAVIVRPPPPQ